MKNKGQKNERTTRLKSMILLVAFTAIMLIVSTYAWFSTQKDITLSNLEGTVKIAEGLEVSLDGNLWRNEIDLSEVDLSAVTTSEKLGTYAVGANHLPTEMKPASTIGSTGSKELKMWTGEFDGSKLTSITLCDEDETSPTAIDYAGYYAFDMFLRNASRGTDEQQIYLSKDSSVTIIPAGDGGDENTGLQNTVRVAFAEFAATSDVNATQTTIIAETVTADPNISEVVIWEPNANYHVDYMVTNASRYNFTDANRDKLMTTYALNDAEVATINDVYATSGDKVTAQKTNQTSVTVPETGHPESYATGPDITTLKNTNATQAAWTIAANKVTRVRVYVWLEGQDIDCINYASFGGGVNVTFGLEKR